MPIHLQPLLILHSAQCWSLYHALLEHSWSNTHTHGQFRVVNQANAQIVRRRGISQREPLQHANSTQKSLGQNQTCNLPALGHQCKPLFLWI